MSVPARWDARTRQRIGEALDNTDAHRRLARRGFAVAASARDIGQAVSVPADTLPVVVAALASFLPLRDTRELASPALGVVNLGRRGFRAAELLLEEIPDLLPVEAMDNTLRLLLELGAPEPALPETRVLADAINLADFGVVGLLHPAVAGDPRTASTDVAERFRLRRRTGYWATRLRDDFHFDKTRRLAQDRLDRAAQVVAWYDDELPTGDDALS